MERNIHERETSIGCLLHLPGMGTGPNPGMCPDQESDQDPSVWGTMPNQLSHTHEGYTFSLCYFLLPSFDVK